MAPRHKSFDQLITDVRTRIKTRAILRGTAITMAIALASLVLAALAANGLSGRTTLLFVLRFLPIAITLGAAWLFVGRALRRKVDDARIALLIEERCRLENRLITAVEFA